MAANSREQARLFAELIEKLEPEVRRAFLASVNDLRANVDWPALLSALEAYDIEGAIAALNIDESAFSEYSNSVTSAYSQAGASTAAQLVQQDIGPIGTRFNMSNPRAQAWIREHVGESVAGFTREQVRAARDLIEAGYQAGAGPRDIAVDLVGRVVGGERQGGIMGLDVPRAERLRIVAEGMKSAQGVRELVTEHQDGTVSVKYKVNEATARRILKAHRDGTAVSPEGQAISVNQYRNLLLKDRADTVAITETGNAVMGARDEQWRQLAEARGLDARNVRKTWRHRRGATQYHRPDHLAMSGHSVMGLDAVFEFPDGVSMRYAHDRIGGPKHIIRCGCDTTYDLVQFVL